MLGIGAQDEYNITNKPIETVIVDNNVTVYEDREVIKYVDRNITVEKIVKLKPTVTCTPVVSYEQ